MALVTVNDQELETFGRFKLQCAFDGKNFEHNFVITGGIMEECIVGMDAINDQGMTIDGADRSVSFTSIFGSIRAKESLVKPVILSFGFVE